MNDENQPLNDKNKKRLDKRSILKWFYRVIQGAVIGVGAILPGISGGVLCVIFGIYKPMMELLAHPIKTFRTHLRILTPVLIGLIIGFVGLARVVDLMFHASYNIATWLFIGLIAGMIPSMFKEAGKEGRPKSAVISLILSTVLILALLLFIRSGSELKLQPNIWWFFVCGVLWGLSLVVPGLSSSSFLIFLGLYQPMTAGIATLSLQVIIPMFIGVFVTIIITARAIDYLFKKHYAIVYNMIVGFVIASTIVIIPLQYEGLTEILWSAACFIVGFAAAWLMYKLGSKKAIK